jgi:2-methylcitrate dehydratase
VFTREYYESDQRSIGNAVQVFFTDGSATQRISIDFPVGHRRRRSEGIPLLMEKFAQAVRAHFSESQASAIVDLGERGAALDAMAIDEFVGAMTTAGRGS